MKKLLIVLVVLLLAAPAMAVEWNFYGSSRFTTFFVDQDGETASDPSDKDVTWDQQTNSRIGATVQLNDKIGGCFEMGGDDFNKRQLYGTYDFGAGELLIGQTEPPSSIFYSNSVYASDGDLLGYGQFYVGRRPMIQVTYDNLKVAFVKPETETYKDANDEDMDTDTTLPKVEVAYAFKGDKFFLDFFGGYQSYEVENSSVAHEIDSYVAGIGGGVEAGPFYFKAGFHMGQNLGNYGASEQDNARLGSVSSDDDVLEDQEGKGYLAVLGFKANDMLTFEAGFGRGESEIDDESYSADLTQYYANATINIAKGFFVVPEIGKIVSSEDGSDYEPETFYVGAKWQINF